MQTRVAFNSGEFSPEMAWRSDLDQYGRACETLENWEVSQMGGIKRRKGMRFLAEAIGENSRLIPYIYSYSMDENQRFLVELSEAIVRVLSYDGEEQARFVSGDEENEVPSFSFSPSKCYYKQINNLLIITSINNPPMVLKRTDEGAWEFEPWEFEQHMWRYNYEQRDYPITISRDGTAYNVTFDEEESQGETASGIKSSEHLRASFWTEQKEAFAGSADLLSGVTRVTTLPSTASENDVFAIATEPTVKYFVCIKAWNVDDLYTPGMDSPANYPNNFLQAENSEDFTDITPVWTIKDFQASGTIAKDTKIAIKSAYWEYWTCFKDFTKPSSSTYDEFKDYPGYFISGIAVGQAIPCRGEWVFYCSGLWFGCYEVRRNYDSSFLDENWEQRGQSFSRNEAASNLQPSGSEADEICYVRLFLTKSKRMDDTSLSAGFPQDSCGNRLIVKSYKHDIVLQAKPDEDGNILWTCNDEIQQDWGSSRKITDWSWQAFSGRYGYPLLCEIYNKRLVFASTEEQPQTIWMSRTDDLKNFSTTGSAETAAMSLTMNTTSQNPLCWLFAQSHRLLLGTSEAEYSISAGQSASGVSNSNVRIEDHSHVGSDGIASVALNDLSLFVERGAGRVYTLQYSFQIDGYTSRDLSVFAPHIGQEHGGVLQMSSIRKPDTVALFVLGDGQLGLCTHNTFHEINAWHRWVTDGKILSVCGMPDGINNDKIFLIVKREEKDANGVVLSESINIEVVDGESDYTDDGRDYASVMVGNAHIDYREGRFGLRASEPNYLCLAEDFTINEDNILVSDDAGKKWLRPPHSGDFILHKGWNKQYTPSGYKYEVQPAIKVTGNQGIHILALRA